jgi:PAS domain S-box-containing protein
MKNAMSPQEPAPGQGQAQLATQTEERLRLLVDALKDHAILMLERDGCIALWNAGAERITGYTAEEAIGQPFEIFYPADQRRRGQPIDHLHTAAEHGRAEDEGWRIRKDGTAFLANTIVNPLRDKAGTLVGYASIIHDLSKREEQRRDLRRVEERFRLLVEAVKDYAIFMLDPDGRVATWNAGAAAIKGYRAEDIIGKHFSTFYPQEAVDRRWPDYELAVARDQGRFEDEGWRMRQDGTRFWANVVITALRDEGGVLLGFAKVTRDLTDRRRIEALEQSNKRINEFLAMLAHELRNPLAPIRNAVTVMHRAHATPEQMDWARGVIDRQITHLTRLVDDLLDMSRITTGKITLRREPLDLREAVARAVEATRPLIEGRRQHLQVDTPPDAVMVLGDVTRLTQVVLNLLNNASKYTPEDGRISVSLVRKAELADILVRDNGIGIPPELLPSIFDLFAQGQRSLDRAEGGLGIGLTLVRRLVEMHGGGVDATSEGPQQGSSFTVTLPLAKDARATAASPRPAAATAAPRRILVVDDNADSADSMAMLLELTGHASRTAHDGPSAFVAAAEFRPDIVLLDLGLPGMSGFDVAVHLRQMDGLERVPIVAMTGYGLDEDRRRTKAAGFAAHLVKPIDPAALEKLVLELAPR